MKTFGFIVLVLLITVSLGYSGSMEEELLHRNQSPYNSNFWDTTGDIFRGLGEGFVAGVQDSKNWTQCVKGWDHLYHHYIDTFKIFADFSFTNLFRGIASFWHDLEFTVMEFRVCANGLLGFLSIFDSFTGLDWIGVFKILGQNCVTYGMDLLSEGIEFFNSCQHQRWFSVFFALGQMLYQIFLSHSVQIAENW
jgi:hypothetical protein